MIHHPLWGTATQPTPNHQVVLAPAHQPTVAGGCREGAHAEGRHVGGAPEAPGRRRRGTKSAAGGCAVGLAQRGDPGGAGRPLDQGGMGCPQPVGHLGGT